MQLNKNENDAINENMIYMKNGKNLLPSKKETNAENISSCVKACLNIVMPLNIDKDTLLFIVTNILILINVFVVFCLVKFLKDFKYENNVINNSLLSVIFLEIFCYGFFSSLLGIFAVKSWHLLCKYDNSFNFFISLLILINFPLVVILSNFVVSRNDIYLYTIKSNENLTEIEAFPFLVSSLPKDDFDFTLNYNDISWNMDNENKSSAKKLCFEIDQSGHCFGKGFPLTIFLEIKNVNKFKKLHFLARKTDNVYISIARPTISDVAKLLKCSSSTKISVSNMKEDLDDYPCRQFKFLNFDNEIVERNCVAFEGTKVKKLDINCRNVQKLDKFIFHNDNVILKKKSVTFSSGQTNNLCCGNKTHFVEYIGLCSKLPTNYLDHFENLKLNYWTPDCPFFGNKKHSMFFKLSQNCIIIISVYAKCKQNFEAINCDLNQYSCNMILKK